MSTALVPINQQPDLAAIEQVLINGNLAQLTQPQRLSYYNQLCQSLGLNPLTKPFEYLNLQGKLVLYARKDCTEQLRKLHGVSVDEVKTERFEDVFVVTAKGHDKTGRTDSATGAVTVGNLKGDMLANAIMKAETKAKRRFTLSICGLGFLDETEIETIPKSAPAGPQAAIHDGQEYPACEECEAPIIGVKLMDGRELTWSEVFSKSKDDHEGHAYCAPCQVKKHQAKKAQSQPAAEPAQPAPADDVTPDPMMTKDLQGKLVIAGTVTEVKDGKPFVIFMGKERIATFSVSLRELLKDAKDQKVILEYIEAEKGGKVYKNVTDVRRIGDQEYDGGVPVTQLNQDLYVNEGETKEPF